MNIRFDVDLFYGNNSHIVHIMPRQDWEEDNYHLTISEDLAFSRDLMFLEEQIFVLDLRKKLLQTKKSPKKDVLMRIMIPTDSVILCCYS